MLNLKNGKRVVATIVNDINFITKDSQTILNKVFDSLRCTHKVWNHECGNLARYTSNGNLFWELHLSTIAESISELIEVR